MTRIKGSKREDVEQKLIQAASELICDLGPNKITIRDIADHAGVNHGQIHHYFGGKKGLLEATYKQLAFEHVQKLDRRKININNLGKESVAKTDPEYFKAIIKAVADEHLELATLEIDEGLSIPRALIQQLKVATKKNVVTSEMKAAVAIACVLEYGLSMMDSYLDVVLDMNKKDKEVFMSYFLESRSAFINKLIKK
ncbi:MAG: TetR/AcrR family transcriptional regulator [Gammaproteobacteria bacterium]|nr:MAG: TetR/AcrR family transcriptional regulator [Gammaproteobacteria bacterium]